MNKVIIVASGVGERMGNNIPKQYISLENESILLRTIRAFEKHEQIHEIIVVILEEHRELFDKHIQEYLWHRKEIKIVYGARERYESVYEGLKACGDNTTIVLIHDGVRPFVSEEEISKSIELAKEKNASLVATPVIDTIKEVDGEKVKFTPDRSKLYRALTPQVFKYNLIKEAYEDFMKNGDKKNITDDTVVVERFGQEVYIVLGHVENIKITTPFDLIVGKAILESRGECR